MTPKSEMGLIRYSLSDFYGMDHPDYLDVFVEFGEDRDKITDLLAMAILNYHTSTPEQLQESIFAKLGYMGVDSDEEAFYAKVDNLADWVARRCSQFIPRGKLELVEAIEDADWVNVVYREYLEPVCETPSLIDSINLSSSLDSTGL
uniref:Uncharacterized protein n=1 Tax=Pseudomonas phage RVTF4 TaxID=3236931 RepID=A0AB39CCN9_9VIRU